VWTVRRRAAANALVLAPFLLCAFAIRFGDRDDQFAWFYLWWTLWFCGLAIWCIDMAWFHFHRFERIVDDVLEALSDHGVEGYDAWLRQSTRTFPQVLAAIAGIAVGAVWVAAVIRVHGGLSVVSGIYAVAVLIASATVACHAYWINRTVRFCHAMAQDGAWNLLPEVPAATIGLQRLSAWFASTSLTVTVGTMGYLVPVVGIGRDLSSLAEGNSIKVLLFFIAFLFVTLIALIPQMTFVGAIRQKKHERIRQLTPQLRAGEPGQVQFEEAAAMIRAVHATPESTTNTLVIAQVLLAFVGAVVGAVLTSGVL
jgi:hypothetical protein